LGLFLAGAAWLLAAPKPPSERITDIRFWSAGGATRVAIEVSGEFRFTAGRISDPDRVFFDISPARIALKPGKSNPLAVGDGLLKQVRLAERQPGTIRVVLDLEPGVEYTASQLSNPERLMVELRAGKSKSSPPASTGAAALPGGAAPPVLSALAASLPRTSLPPVLTPEPEPAPAPARPAPALATPAEPKPAQRNSNGDRSLTRVLGLKLTRIVLDPGHGGHDQGTSSKSGLLEKEIALDVSKRLAALLTERLGTEVILTRTDDSYLALEERTRIANESRADLFLSIHVNSSPVKSVAGIETFYLNFSAGREDLDLATRENATSERSIADLKEVVSKIALRAKLDESREFAQRVQASLHSLAAKQNKDAKDRGVKRAPFVVLIGADMPSVLAEIGFLSNARDEVLLKSSEHRDRIAEALYQAIAGYAESLSRTSQVASSR
jgi:N-acetylmuramoyl-L-alanine amidase